MAISSRKGCRDERQRRERERDREREAAVETLPAGRADWPFDCWLSEAVFGQQLAAGGTGHLFSLLVFLWRACQTHGCGVPARASHTHLSAAPQTPDGKRVLAR